VIVAVLPSDGEAVWSTWPEYLKRKMEGGEADKRNVQDLIQVDLNHHENGSCKFVSTNRKVKGGI
jgi:hypothetical protein